MCQCASEVFVHATSWLHPCVPTWTLPLRWCWFLSVKIWSDSRDDCLVVVVVCVCMCVCICLAQDTPMVTLRPGNAHRGVGKAAAMEGILYTLKTVMITINEGARLLLRYLLCYLKDDARLGQQGRPRGGRGHGPHSKEKYILI